MSAIERLRAALQDKPRGFRGSAGGRLMVEVRAEDLREVANGLAADPHAANLARGAAPFRNEKPDRTVVVQADDLHRLLDQVGDTRERQARGS